MSHYLTGVSLALGQLHSQKGNMFGLMKILKRSSTNSALNKTSKSCSGSFWRRYVSMRHLLMKNVLFMVLFIYVQPSIADVCAVNKNVRDYFLSIPSEMLEVFDDEKGPLVSRQERESAIDTIDIKNGFITLQSETIISKYEVALYRAVGRKPVVIVTADGVSVQNAYAFNCFGGKWHDVSNTIFPKKSYEDIANLYLSGGITIDGKPLNENELAMVAHTLLRYKLPRIGKSIQAYASHPDIKKPEESVLYSFEPEIPNLVWE